MNMKYFILLLFSVYGTSALSWKVLGKIRFHKSVTLECKLNSSDIFALRWTIGPWHKVLTYGGDSYFPEKYHVSLNLKIGSYFLTILNFNEDDIDIYYHCNNGYSQFTKTIILNDNYEMWPEGNWTKLYYENDFHNINITIGRVYPKPSCTLFINNKSVVTNEKVKKLHHFLIIEYTKIIKINISITNIYLQCNIGTFSDLYTIIISNYSKLEPKPKPGMILDKKITAKVALILFIIIIIIFCILGIIKLYSTYIKTIIFI